MKPQAGAGGRGEEPPMFLQRPSVAKSQDVRHILAKTFRDLYTRDTIDPDTVRNLSVSKGGDDPYHERYVESLQKIFDERQRRLDEAAKLERHIMQAQARAMSADERELNRMTKSCDNYHDLGLPPGRSHFRSCIDSTMLSKHKLLTPEDYATEEPAAVPPPSAPKIPSYARETVSSQQRIQDSRRDARDESPLLMLQNPQSKSDLGGLAGPSFISEEGEIGEDGESYSPLQTERPGLPDWKLHLSEAQRELDRHDLANLQAKVNFKRNPRHVPPSAPPGGRTLVKSYKPKPKEIGIEQKVDKDIPMEPSLVFLVSPPEVVFKDYKVGQIYEITLELKNVSAVLRQCRALPPSSPYFSVGLGQFPGEHGLVAPGMSCHYAIRFAPDSLKDFEDEIRIQTQSTDPIVVPLRGRREPPKVSLPREIDVGFTLVGGCHVTQLLIRNEGGSGRFCIIPRSSWPATNFKSVVVNGGVALPPFEVRPSVLELTKGQTGIMEVVFTPLSVKSYTQEMTVVCDNCHVKHFTLKGESQKAGVELVGVERGTGEVMPGELCDLTAQHLIRFDDLNPFTYTDRGVTIKNTTNVKLPFQWMIFKPEMSGSDDLERKNERVPDVDSVFSVHPPTGVIPPCEEMEFRVTFAPPVVNDFHSVLHLLLQQVPPYDEEGSAKSNKGDKNREGSLMIDNGEDEETMSEIFLNNDIKQFRDVTAMEIEVKGKSVPLNVVLHPYGIYVPGQNLLGTTVKKLVTMANHSRSTITFQWQPYHERYILEVEPPFGELDPGMAMDLELSITGTEPGKLEHTLYCYVMNLDEPLHLHVEAEFKGPEVNIDAADINFGLIRLGQTIKKEVTINNMSQMPTKWSIRDTTDFIEDPRAEGEFKFLPSEGELKPLETSTITVEFTPTSNKSVNTIFELQVEEGSKINIAVLAEVQSPTVCLSSCEICMEEVYKNVPVKYQAILVNQTLLATEFKWGEVEGSHRDDCSIELGVTKGILVPREEKVINVSFLAFREGEYSDLRIPCVIEGMDKPLYLGLFCDVKGLSVQYRVSQERYGEFSDDLHLEYGEVELGTVPKIFLHIRNESAIMAPYSLNMEYFNAKPPTPPEEKNRENSGLLSSQRRALLSRTPNLADPMAKTPKKEQDDLCKSMLSLGNGAAFVPKSGSGDMRLQPFGEEVIELSAYSDMWGDYTDNLVCKMGDLDPVSIPVSMKVKGCPLQFQMTSANPDLKPVVRFGTHVSGVAPVHRMMRVNNISPYDIRVDWEVYNIEENDKKLLDLTVAFGNPFPVRDESGNEIVPPWAVPEPPKRQPTDFIPNTPGTSAGSRREPSVTPNKPPTQPSEEELLNSRRKVVSLFYRAHEGNKSTDPYSIRTSQIVIPARGFANIHLAFTPFPMEMVTTEMDCVGYALGFMSLDKSPSVEGKVSRDQALAVDPLRLDVTAHIKPALLTIESTDEEGMIYRSAMSDLLQADGRTCSESLRVCSTMLSNQTETPLVFKLLTRPPFLLVDLDPSTNAFSSTRSTETEFQTLRPQHNLLVKVAFQTTTDLLGRLNDTDSNASTTEDEGESLTDVTNVDGKKINVKDTLIVQFNNSAVQKVPLIATVSVPQVELSKESLDFGTCLVGQKRELQILITNKTSSHTYWFSLLDSCSESCSSDTFRIEPTSGHLEAHITHVSNSKALLKIFFTAKHAEMYEGLFIFRGNLGEEPRRLYVRGQGSYDGKHEAVLNV